MLAKLSMLKLAMLSVLELAMLEFPVAHVTTTVSIVAMGNVVCTICSGGGGSTPNEQSPYAMSMG